MLDIIAIPFGYLMQFCIKISANNYALALLFFTLLFKLILLPLNIKQQKSSISMAQVRPKEMAIRKRYEGRTDMDARVAVSQEIQALYKSENVSYSGGCLPMLIQFPIIIALYRIVQQPLTYLNHLAVETINSLKETVFQAFSVGTLNASNTSEHLSEIFTNANGDLSKFALNEIQLTDIISNHSNVFETSNIEGLLLPNFNLFGINLAETPYLGLSIIIIIPILAALSQYFSTIILQKFSMVDTSTPEAQSAASTMKTMNIVFPIMTLILAFQLPSIIGLYWVYQSIISTGIQAILYKKLPAPKYTQEEIDKIIAEYNKNFVPEVKPSTKPHSLHDIDADDEISEENGVEYVDKTINEDIIEEKRPVRKKFDKNGNPIRSLHYIDEDDDEITNNTDKTNTTGDENEN